MNICQAEIPPLELVGQLCVITPQRLKNHGVNVMYLHFIPLGVETKFIG